MELDELKQVWQDYDKKLEKNLKVNEELLRTMKLKMVSSQLRKFMNLEIVGLIFSTLMSVVVFNIVWHNRGIPGMLICGGICLLFFIYSIWSGSKSLQYLYHIDEPSNSVADMQKSLTKYEVWYQLSKKIGLFIFPVAVAALIPIATMWVQNYNVFDNPGFYFRQIFFAIFFGFILLLLTYKLTDKKMRRTREYLNQIEDFSSEEQSTP